MSPNQPKQSDCDIPQYFPLERFVAPQGPFPSLDWAKRRLSRREFRGVYVARKWFMTAEDFALAMEAMRPSETATPTGLTEAGQRRTA